VTSIRAARLDDAAAIASLYSSYVMESAVTFETEPVAAATIGERMRGGQALYPWLVSIDQDGSLLGYAYAARFRERAAYRFAVETTVYVDPHAQRRRIGTSLYSRLIEILTRQGFTQAIAAITLPNPSSVGLHEALGFMPAGVYRQVGYKLGAWHDVGLWQRPLAERANPPAEPRPLTAIGANS
jgi:L-amino acid N-acyltransferase YncA